MSQVPVNPPTSGQPSPSPSPSPPQPYASPATRDSAAPASPGLAGWQSVAGGLRLSRIGYLTAFVSTLLAIPAFVGAALLGYALEEREVTLMLVIAVGVLYVIPWLTGCILVFVGYGKCCRVPAESRAKGLVITGFILMISGWPLQFPALCLGLPPVQEALRDLPDVVAAAGAILWLVALLMMFTGNLLYFLFLWKVNKYWGNAAGAKNVLLFIAFWIGGALAMIAALIATAAIGALLADSMGPAPGVTCLVLTGLGALAFLIALPIWLSRVFGLTRKTVLDGIRGTPATPFAAAAKPGSPFGS
jgi:hypothetical protein